MKKNNLYYIAIFFSMLLTVSCEDELELISEDDLSPEQALSTPGSIEGLVLGLYSEAQTADVLNGTPQTMTEWQADNSEFKGSFPTFNEFQNYTPLSTNTSVGAIWIENVNIIEASNFIINRLPEVDLVDLDDDTRNQFIGEARFMRALILFNLSKYFGQPFQYEKGESPSVPVILEDFQGDETPFDQPRNTLNEVYAQIEDDLEFARENLPESYSSNADTRGRATYGAATALLARMELYRENDEEAAELADEVIADSNYELADGFDFYDGLTSEDIFSIINSAIDPQTGNESYAGLTNPTPEGRGDAPFSESLVDAYMEEEGDLRFSELTQEGEDAEGSDSYFTTKFDDGVNNSDNAPIIRVTEMYLIRAEANLKAGTSIGATPLEDINLLRNRAGLDDLDAVDIDDILRERRKELAFEEGHRRMDLLRNGKSLREGLDDEENANVGDPFVIFPIPQREIDNSSELEQNPGY